MAARLRLPGMRRFLWLRIASVRTGILTGIYASCVLVAWLIVANRIPALEPFAEAGNIAAEVIVILLLVIPVFRFRSAPGKLFVAGLTAWTLLTAAYLAAQMHFTPLESRLGALQIFMLGAVSYGIVAVFDWVFLMCAGVRHQHLARSGGRTPSAGRRRAN
jgi:hypothetical protein